MWKCPKCGRTFKNINQWHSCVQISEDEVMQKFGDHVKAIYLKLSKNLKKLGDMQISQAGSAIFYKNGSTFLTVKPKKETLQIEFLLKEEINEFPISKTFRMSKNRIVHTVILDETGQVDKQLLNWLKEAYGIVKS